MRALEAVMDGFQVTTMEHAATFGDIFVTVTGDINVIDVQHFEKMKSGAIVSNSGHFNVELNLEGLRKRSGSEPRLVRPFVEEYTVDGRPIYVLGEGRLINLAAAEGHPASVMDMSFANQALGAEYMMKNGKTMKPQVYRIPEEVDKEIARIKLEAMGVKIDKLTPEQAHYLNQWEEGT
jgi:adenosylhomocysteinase